MSIAYARFDLRTGVVAVTKGIFDDRVYISYVNRPFSCSFVSRRDIALNEKTHFYEADEGAHTIRIGADIFMLKLDEMITTGLSEQEALDELFRINTWYHMLPCPDVYIDGIEQND